MPDGNLKHLNRTELVEIILKLKKQDEEKQTRLDELNAQLADRTLRIEQAGSIAEAALSVNRVFEAAQAAADQYLLALHAANAESAAARLIQEAEERAAAAEQRAANAERRAKEAERYADETEAYAKQITEDAEAHAKRLVAEAEQECEATWERLRKQAEDLFQAHAELNGLLRNENDTGTNESTSFSEEK